MPIPLIRLKKNRKPKRSNLKSCSIFKNQKILFLTYYWKLNHNLECVRQRKKIAFSDWIAHFLSLGFHANETIPELKKKWHQEAKESEELSQQVKEAEESLKVAQEEAKEYDRQLQLLGEICENFHDFQEALQMLLSISLLRKNFRKFQACKNSLDSFVSLLLKDLFQDFEQPYIKLFEQKKFVARLETLLEIFRDSLCSLEKENGLQKAKTAIKLAQNLARETEDFTLSFRL